MGAHPIVTPPLNEKFPLSLGIEEPQATRVGRSIPSRALLRPILAPAGKNWFAEAMLEVSPTRPQRHTRDVVKSVALHLAIVATVFLLPLYFTQTIDLRQERRTVQWNEIPAEKLQEALGTHRPVCWSCHIAETFRREHPERIVDRPPDGLRMSFYR